MLAAPANSHATRSEHSVLYRQPLPEEMPLLRFLTSLDRLTSPQLPAERHLWMSALAMPLALDAGLRRQAMQVSSWLPRLILTLALG